MQIQWLAAIWHSSFNHSNPILSWRTDFHFRDLFMGVVHFTNTITRCILITDSCFILAIFTWWWCDELMNSFGFIYGKYHIALTIVITFNLSCLLVLSLFIHRPFQLQEQFPLKIDFRLVHDRLSSHRMAFTQHCSTCSGIQFVRWDL